VTLTALLSIKPLQTSVVSYGAGTNSTAMLIGLHERGERPDLILFADTGGERPETYQHRDAVSDWCESVGFPRIVTVQTQDREGNYFTLEQKCQQQKMLPSIAYGMKACSEKHKARPQNKYVNNWQPAKDTWAAGERVVKLIGFDADENHRMQKDYSDNKYLMRYPLVEWDWGREECIEAIARAGLSQPGKSACFFCPSSKPREILELGRTHPDLLQRALAMEARAELTSVKGLGRSFAWADLVKYSEAQLDLFSHTPEIPCGCFDG